MGFDRDALRVRVSITYSVCPTCSPFTLTSMHNGFDRDSYVHIYIYTRASARVRLCTLSHPQLHCTGRGFPKWELSATAETAATVPSSHLHLSIMWCLNTYPSPITKHPQTPQTLDITTFSLHSHHIYTHLCIFPYTHAYNIIRKHNPPIGGMGLRYTHPQHQ